MYLILMILLIINFRRLNFEPTPNPQLDLPPLPPPSSARPMVLLNSYAEGRDYRNGPTNYDPNPYNRERDRPSFNEERSNRYGPPYHDDGDDEVDDRPRNDRPRNGYGNSYNRDQPHNAHNPYNSYNSNTNDNDYEKFRVEEERREHIKNENLRQILQEIDQKSSQECSLNVAAQWLFETNVNEATQLEALAAQQRYSDFQRLLWLEMKHINQSDIFDEFLYRQVRLMSIIGPSALPPDQLDRYNRIINDMLAIYNGGSICAYEQPFNCGLRLQPQLKQIMAKSRDWDELQYVWLEWRRKTGRNMKDLYEQMIGLTNDAAHLNNFTSGEDYWTFPFDSANFRQDVEDVWEEIRPLYEALHAYVRRKLREFYGPDKISRDAPLPDHVFGNMYGQSWANILDITIPYPGRSFLEVTSDMVAQGYTPLVMFQLAEEFFISMNMTALPPPFWINSIFVEPVDRVVLCQPSTWDFCTGADYRIKMCTKITHKDLLTAHQEMAHIQYFINYRGLPKVFRDGANPGFHDAIGDAITLSVSTPQHLQKLGLVHKSVDDTAHEINFLFALAMDKVVFLPFALTLDTWRWDIFSKRVSREQYNCHWWLLRERYGGIKPPVLRSELDFDPGSKYHVPANIPYMR